MARILVVDDDPLLRLMLEAYLSNYSYEVKVAEDGVIGIDVAETWQPDLIICDVAMPNLDGLGVLRHLQAHEDLADVPFIFLTGNGDKETIRQGRALGADDFLTKPFDMDELVEVVKTRLAKRQRRQALVTKAIDDLRMNITTALPHELRTAIMIMEGYALLVLEDADNIDAVQREMMESIRDNAVRLRNMAEKYIWYLRAFLPNHMARTSQNRDPAAVIQAVVFNVAQRFNRLGDLEINLETAALHINEEYLSKIAEEIVENAFKFSQAGTTVSITGQVLDPNYQFIVSDVGREMSADQIERIGAFMQFDRTLYEQQGTGLGLIIAKRLIELGDGTLTVESAAAQTNIIVTLPLALNTNPNS
jgi:DNA-binding response OmpR family regulator